MSQESISPELTIREAAKLLGLRPRTLRSYVKSGELEPRGSLWRRRVSRRDLVSLVSKYARERWSAMCGGFDAAPFDKRGEWGQELLDDWELVAVPPRERVAALASAFDGKIARAYQIFPFDLESQPKKCLAAVPTANPQLGDELSRLLGGTVELVIAHRNPFRNQKIVARLIHHHFPDPDGPSPLSRREHYHLDREPMRAFLGDIGDVLRRDGHPALVRLLGLITAESVKAGASDADFVPTEDALEVYFKWGDFCGQINSVPPRLFWALTFTATAVFGMDPTQIDSPQDGRAEAQFKNGTVLVSATSEPGEFGPALSLSFERHLSAEPAAQPAS